MNPYTKLPEKAFWKTAVASKSMFDVSDLWSPKFNIKPNHRVATFGSCFAQHIGNALKQKGFNWFIAETPPESLSEKNARRFSYNIFSARTANIYTTSLLRQWTEWALGKTSPPEEIWESDGSFFDPFRPVIEPGGFCSAEELKLSRNECVKSFRRCIKESHFFVFTLGLTESWFNSKKGYEYPMCPGTAAGGYDETLHVFKNQQFEQIRKNLAHAMELMRKENPGLKFILTVSPVPLTATKSSNNVIVATMESKSILRAVAGQLAKNRKYVDYFPSYEIINSPVFKGAFFEPNQRSVNPAGVSFVMDHFFSSLSSKFGAVPDKKNMEKDSPVADLDDTVCEEELLEAFGGTK